MTTTQDATGRTILLTGATDGIGLITARRLAACGATLYLHGRSPQRLAAAAEAVAAETGRAPAGTFTADFTSLDDVRGLAAAVRETLPRLDVLLNNAGIGAGPRGASVREESADGFELRLAVNHLAPFLLTRLLEPLLIASAPARVVNVASAGQRDLDFDDLQFTRGYDGITAYCKAKLAMIMASFEQAERLRPHGVTVNALHPGSLLATKMVHEGFGAPRGVPETGADAELRLALDPDLAGVTGRYFDVDREADPLPQALDPEARARLWRASCTMCGIQA